MLSVEIGLFLQAGLFLPPLSAQENKPTVVSEAQPKPEPSKERKVPLLSRALRLSDFAGMRPAAELKDQLAKMDGFTQSSPVDGQPATEKTQAFLGRTGTALYVAFLCFDRQPQLVRGHLARRENILKDDSVSVLLDTFQDHRRGVLFALNPMAVQADAAWTEGTQPDYSYDQVWDSSSATTREGWMVLFAIPFRSLRFPPGGQAWGVVLQRNLPRNSETDTWPHIATSISGTLPQEGTLFGVEGLPGSRHVQINPYALAQKEKRLNSLDAGNPYFSSRQLEGTAGGEVKAIVRESIVLDATVNPDFSDVESDQPQFTVNQRFPVYFPELRPFFLENANYFATPIQLLNTRNIVNPEFGGRVTGKLGGLNLGLLAVDDRQPGQLFPRGDPNYGKRGIYGVGRLSEDLGKGSSVGLMYTDKEFAGTWNRIGGIDFTARLNDKWTAQGQAVESSTKHQDGSYAAGPASYLEFSRSGHAFNFDDTYQDYSSGFETRVGFIRSSNQRYNQNHATYQWYPKHSFLQNWGLETSNSFAFDHQGNRVYRYVTVDPFFQMAGNTTVAPLLGQNSDTLGPQNGYALTRNRNFTEDFVGLVVRSQPFRQVSFNIVTLYGGNVNYNPAAGAAPSLLKQNFVQALITLQPIRSLTLDNTYLLDRDRETSSGAPAFESQTLRTKMNYQFTRALSARVIVEYDSVLVNPAVTSLARTKQLSTEALITWLPHPGTAIYLGYNNDLANIDRTLCSRGIGGTCDPGQPILSRSSQYLNDGRQFFLKASYLFRF